MGPRARQLLICFACCLAASVQAFCTLNAAQTTSRLQHSKRMAQAAESDPTSSSSSSVDAALAAASAALATLLMEKALESDIDESIEQAVAAANAALAAAQREIEEETQDTDGQAHDFTASMMSMGHLAQSPKGSTTKKSYSAVDKDDVSFIWTH
jgi:putative alpha-1,2-mannosidase